MRSSMATSTIIKEHRKAARELNKPDNRGVKLRAREELWKKLGF